MKTIFKILSLLFVFICLCTCKKKDETPASDAIVLAKEVKVIDIQTWNKQFISLDSTNYTITFSKNINSTKQIKVGDILVSGSGEGLLRRVKDVSTVGDELKVQTESATLTDIIQQGTIEVNQPLTVSQIRSIDYHYAGIKLNEDNLKGPDQLQFSWDINTLLYDNDGNLSTTNDQIKLIGTFACDWKLALKIDVGFREGLKEVQFGYESSENLDLQLVAGLQYNFEKKITLATVNFVPVTVLVGAVPVVFTPTLQIIVGVDGSANGSVTSRITQTMSFNAGAKYLKADGWKPFNTFNKTIGFQPPQLNVNASAGAYLKPEFSIKIYGIAGPYANLKLYGRIDANILQTPWWNLYGGITMDAGAKVDILDKFLLEFTFSDLIKYEQMLAQATTPPLFLPTVTTNNITTFTSTTATIGGNVTSDGNASVTERGIYWGISQNPETTGNKIQIGSGTGSFSTSLTGLNSSTVYYIKAYAINSQGVAYGTQVSFTTSIKPNNPPAAPSNPNPANGAASQSITPTLSWTCSDPDGDAITYDIYFGTTTNPTTTIATNQTATTLSRTGLSNGTTYYWKVLAKDSNGASTTGPIWSFTTIAPIALPTVTTAAVNNYTSTTAVFGGNVTGDGGAAVSERGVYYGTSPNPETTGLQLQIGSGTGSFSYTRSGLSASTTYYVKAYAINSRGPAYGSQVSFTTLPTSALSGKISGIVRNAVTADPLSGVSANVYLSSANIASSVSQSDGRYEIIVPVNTGYKVVFSKQGFLSAEYQNIDVASNGNTILEPILQIDQTYSGNGNIGGTIKDALNGTGISGVSLNLRNGINVTSGSIITSTTTSSSGAYTINSIPAGNYTVEATNPNYNTSYFTVLCLGGQTIANQDATMSPKLNTGETRIVLTWGATPSDLDSHFTGPLADGTRFHMYFWYTGSSSPWPDIVMLDLDDVTSYGPETTTLFQQISGTYRFSVHDYSDRSSSNSYALSNSGAQVRVYQNSGLVATFNVPPNTGGTLWTVFEMSETTITSINQMSYVSDPSAVNKSRYKNPDAGLFWNLPKK